jgi:hypothetical protein
MALQTRAIEHDTAATREARLRRWCLLAILGAMLLGVYVGTLSWVTRQVEAGVERSIQPLPVLIRDLPGN